MTITLDTDLETVVQRKIDDGLYGDADEVIREALRLLDQHDRVRLLRAKLARAEEQADRGEGRQATPELFEELKRNAMRNAAAGHTPNPDVHP